MIEVEPINAKLGDLVELDRGLAGVVVGISSQNDCVLVRWGAETGIDVIGINSPLWYGSTLYRDELCEDEGCPQYETEHVCTLPECKCIDGVITATFRGSPSYELVPSPTLTLPWATAAEGEWNANP